MGSQTRISRVGAEQQNISGDRAAAPQARDAWFRAKIQQASDDLRPSVPHQQVMNEAQALIDRKRLTLDWRETARVDLLTLISSSNSV